MEVQFDQKPHTHIPQPPPRKQKKKTSKKPQVGSDSQAKILTPFKVLKPKIHKDQDIWGIDCNGCQNKHLTIPPPPPAKTHVKHFRVRGSLI